MTLPNNPTLPLNFIILAAEYGGVTTAWGWGRTRAEARAMNDALPEGAEHFLRCSREMVTWLEATNEDVPDLNESRFDAHIKAF